MRNTIEKRNNSIHPFGIHTWYRKNLERHLPIEEVIGQHVDLRKVDRSGRRYVGLCPFHREKTPSFYVLTWKSVYRCCGCGAGGNVFKFLLELRLQKAQSAVLKIEEMDPSQFGLIFRASQFFIDEWTFRDYVEELVSF